MKNRHQIISYLLASGIFLLMCSCTHEYKININYDVFPLKTKKLPQKIGLCLIPEYCQYSFSQGRFLDRYIFDLGKALCDGTEKMLNAAFSQVVILRSMDADISGQEIKAIAVPEIIVSDIVLPDIAWKDVKALITIKYTFVNPDNKKIIWLDTFQGKGQAKLGTAFSGSKNIRKAMRIAIEDQFLKALGAITSCDVWKSL